jgi:hypothetical protein
MNCPAEDAAETPPTEDVAACACCGSTAHPVAPAANGATYCAQCAETLRRSVGRPSA